MISEYYDKNLGILSGEKYNILEEYILQLIELENYDNCWFYGNLLSSNKKSFDKIIYYYELGIEKINCVSCMNNLAIFYITNNFKKLDKIENLFSAMIYLGEKAGVTNLYRFYKTYHSKEKADNFIKDFFSNCENYTDHTDIDTMRQITCRFIDIFINLNNITNLEKYMRLKKASDDIQLSNYDNIIKELENNDIHIKIYNIKKKIKKRYYQCDICYEKKNCIPSNCFTDHYMCYDCYFIQYDKPCHICRYYNHDYNSVYLIAKNLIDKITKLENENKSLKLDIEKLKK